MLNRANVKNNLKDYKGAIADYNKAIEIDSNDAIAYVNRGIAKYLLKDYKGSIADNNKAIEIDPNYTKAYVNRGAAKHILNENSCDDFKKACDLGSCEAFNQLCK